jgi:hypothetical protein
VRWKSLQQAAKFSAPKTLLLLNKRRLSHLERRLLCRLVMKDVIEIRADQKDAKRPIQMTPKGVRKPVKIVSIARKARLTFLTMPKRKSGVNEWPFCVA